MAWATPIMQCNAMKAELCLAWRKQLETGCAVSASPFRMQHVGAVLEEEDEETKKRMLIGAMYKPPEELHARDDNNDGHDGELQQPLINMQDDGSFSHLTSMPMASTYASSLHGPSEWLKKMSIFG